MIILRQLVSEHVRKPRAPALLPRDKVNNGLIAMLIQNLQLERVNTPTGPMLIMTDADDRLCAVDWEDHEERMRRLLGRRFGSEGFRVQARQEASTARRALDAYFEGDWEAVARLAVRDGGTVFQSEVWKALRSIPAGEAISYGELAARIGRPAAVRAVGLANGSNPVAIVVPCHRVIGANGSLTGYGGGLDRKRWLLAHERKSASGQIKGTQFLLA